MLVNGSLEGFFTSARGIRHGCSLSPYPYIILNNLLSKMLKKAAEEGRFAYHPQCQGVKLTHLSFADDILVFTNGIAASLQGVLQVMESFAGMSDLRINAAKSKMFVAGQELAPILSEAAPRGIPVGNLPICYLGMPLTTKSLTAQEYEPLIDKVRGRMPILNVLLSGKNWCDDSLEEEQTLIGVKR